MKTYCKCCFAKTPNKVFCDECQELGVTSFGSDVDYDTGKVKPKKKETISDKRKKASEDEWEEVPSPYKKYKEGV
jgi:hypothetical protein